MGRSILLDSYGCDITCMKEFDALRYPCDGCTREDCEEREEYHDISNSRSKKSVHGT